MLERMAVPSNMLAPILVSGIVWLLVAFMIMFPLVVSGGATQAITLGIMILLTLVNIIMFLV